MERVIRVRVTRVGVSWDKVIRVTGERVIRVRVTRHRAIRVTMDRATRVRVTMERVIRVRVTWDRVTRERGEGSLGIGLGYLG